LCRIYLWNGLNPCTSLVLFTCLLVVMFHHHHFVKYSQCSKIFLRKFVDLNELYILCSKHIFLYSELKFTQFLVYTPKTKFHHYLSVVSEMKCMYIWTHTLPIMHLFYALTKIGTVWCFHNVYLKKVFIVIGLTVY
jgi:hypothetical protein